MRHGRGWSGARLIAGAALLGVAACGSGGEADRELERVASWSATARLVAEQRASGALSARYTANTLHAAHAELARSAASLRAALDSSSDSARLSPVERARAVAAASRAERTVDWMARIADSRPDDRAALLGAAAALDTTGPLARALADSAKRGG